MCVTKNLVLKAQYWRKKMFNLLLQLFLHRYIFFIHTLFGLYIFASLQVLDTVYFKARSPCHYHD